MSAEASPRPWVAYATREIDMAIGATIDAGRVRLVASVFVQPDAELIVRAVNAHDDLVAALKAAKSAILYADRIIDDVVTTNKLAEMVEAIDAALAKAGAA